MKSKKGKGNQPERYWKKFAQHVQRGLKALNIIGALPEVKMGQPNKAVRIFLTKLETRFGKKDLGIKKQTVMVILGAIRTGLMKAEDDQEKARWFMAFLSKLGIEMSVTGALEVLDGLDAMDEFLLHQAKREFKKHFGTSQKKEEEEVDDDVIEGDPDDEEEDDEDETGESESETAPQTEPAPAGAAESTE